MRVSSHSSATNVRLAFMSKLIYWRTLGSTLAKSSSAIFPIVANPSALWVTLNNIKQLIFTATMLHVHLSVHSLVVRKHFPIRTRIVHINWFMKRKSSVARFVERSLERVKVWRFITWSTRTSSSSLVTFAVFYSSTRTNATIMSELTQLNESWSVSIVRRSSSRKLSSSLTCKHIRL